MSWKRFVGFAIHSPRLTVTQLEEINEQLAALAKEPDALSPSMLRAIQRHRELFQDNVRELNRTKVRIVS